MTIPRYSRHRWTTNGIGIGKMRRQAFRIGLFFLLAFAAGTLSAQEVLLPVRYARPMAPKQADTLTLPFFDDFSTVGATPYVGPWTLEGAFVNEGYAPLPPTVGMVTLDAFDADGALYPTTTGDLYYGDTLTSLPLRLDSVFIPYARALTPDDSLYLSFYYLPGGGAGNMWERIGDCPNAHDSLLLEFYDPEAQKWAVVWGRGGVSVDSLIASTGTDWQYVLVPVVDTKYFKAGFQFRFRNYCSLDGGNKTGMLSNADQWNLDYVLLDKERSCSGRASRDVAFVNPAPSMLRRYKAMPAMQYSPSEMATSLALTITNLYSEELATSYGYDILDEAGNNLHEYNGGYENAPAFWPDAVYQTSAAHARPTVDYAFSFDPSEAPVTFRVVHHVREGVSGDPRPSNDTVVYTQVFDNYFSYDDGVAENGYGITSTSTPIRMACRFVLTREDTMTAVDLYFNRTYHDENGTLRFLIKIWDDNNGRPGNVIYQDENRRKPLFEGFNQYVRYALERPLTCNGTIYVGLEQVSADFLNLGFDRNNDASSQIVYQTGVGWQTSILRGALMLRPCFGQRAVASVADRTVEAGRVYAQGRSIVVERTSQATVQVYDVTGRCMFASPAAEGIVRTPALAPGVYIVKVGRSGTVRKVVVF